MKSASWLLAAAASLPLVLSACSSNNAPTDDDLHKALVGLIDEQEQQISQIGGDDASAPLKDELLKNFEAAKEQVSKAELKNCTEDGDNSYRCDVLNPANNATKSMKLVKKDDGSWAIGE